MQYEVKEPKYVSYLNYFIDYHFINKVSIIRKQ